MEAIELINERIILMREQHEKNPSWDCTNKMESLCRDLQRIANP